jgi:hypothetical protein
MNRLDAEAPRDEVPFEVSFPAWSEVLPDELSLVEVPLDVLFSEALLESFQAWPEVLSDELSLVEVPFAEAPLEEILNSEDPLNTMPVG